MITPSASPGDPELSLIIVSFNTRELTLRCLAALEPELGEISHEVFVVDNASQDGSPAAIREAFPMVRIFEQDQNLGFGAANNVALREASGRFILLLNSDALVHRGALAGMRDCLVRNPGVGVVGPRLLNADGSLQRSCWRFPSPMRSWLESLWISGVFSNHRSLGDYRDWPHDQERVVEFVVGACLMVRREVYDKVGGFDERFFLYAEETDWQRRITHAGWKVMFCPHGVVTHLSGASGRQDVREVNRHFLEGFDKFQLKYHGKFGLRLARAAVFAGSLIRLLAWSGAAVFPVNRGRARTQVRRQIQIARRQLRTGLPR